MPSQNQQKETARERLTRKYAEFLSMRMDDIEADITTHLVSGRPGEHQNLSGNPYTGSNPFYLSMVSAAYGWELPVWLTWNQIDELGLSNKGAHGHPVQRWIPFQVKDKETGKDVDMTEAQYRALPKEVRELYDVKEPKLLVFNMFNIDQTNFAVVYPDVYRELQKACLDRSAVAASCDILDTMLADPQNGWVSEIRTGDDIRVATYDPEYDIISLPSKERYLDQKDFYTDLLRCMAESTCIEERLDLNFTKGCGDNSMTPVAMRKLASELTASTMLTMFGFQPTMSETSRSHIKAWKGALGTNPSLAMDVVKASGEGSRFILSKLGLEQEKGINVQQMMDGVALAEENRRKYQEKIEAFKERRELKENGNSKRKGYVIVEKTTVVNHKISKH